MNSQNISYRVTFHTRVTAQSKTASDNFFVKNCLIYYVIVQGEITLLSDHHGQILEIKIRNSERNNHTGLTCEKRSFKTVLNINKELNMVRYIFGFNRK